jgi:hypothetical protein
VTSDNNAKTQKEAIMQRSLKMKNFLIAIGILLGSAGLSSAMDPEERFNHEKINWTDQTFQRFGFKEALLSLKDSIKKARPSKKIILERVKHCLSRITHSLKFFESHLTLHDFNRLIQELRFDMLMEFQEGNFSEWPLDAFWPVYQLWRWLWQQWQTFHPNCNSLEFWFENKVFYRGEYLPIPLAFWECGGWILFCDAFSIDTFHELYLGYKNSNGNYLEEILLESIFTQGSCWEQEGAALNRWLDGHEAALYLNLWIWLRRYFVQYGINVSLCNSLLVKIKKLCAHAMDVYFKLTSIPIHKTSKFNNEGMTRRLRVYWLDAYPCSRNFLHALYDYWSLMPEKKDVLASLNVLLQCIHHNPGQMAQLTDFIKNNPILWFSPEVVDQLEPFVWQDAKPWLEGIFLPALTQYWAMADAEEALSILGSLLQLMNGDMGNYKKLRLFITDNIRSLANDPYALIQLLNWSEGIACLPDPSLRRYIKELIQIILMAQPDPEPLLIQGEANTGNAPHTLIHTVQLATPANLPTPPSRPFAHRSSL